MIAFLRNHNLNDIAVFVNTPRLAGATLRSMASARLSETFRERFFSVVERGDQSRIAGRAGLNPSTISRWRNGAEPINLRFDTAEKLAEAIRKPVAWLLGIDAEEIAACSDPSEFVHVPRLESAVAAGPPMIQDDRVASRLPFLRSFVADVAPGGATTDALARRRLVCIPVDRRWGDSMVPDLRPGELLLVDREPPEVADRRLKDDAIYLVSPEPDSLTAKYAAVEPGGKRLICWPRNPDDKNKAFTIRLAQDAALSRYVRGRVLWSAGRA